MIDETTGPGERSEAPQGQRSAAPEGQTDTGGRVAFCQQCGTGLTSATVRRVGSAIYCEPCLVARLEATGSATSSAGPAGTGTWQGSGFGAEQGPGFSTAGAGWTPVGGAVPPPGATPPPPSGPAPNEPIPWLAAFLGLIPGVGAMYNGQYAKGVAHLVIFVVLDSLQKNVSDIFGLLVLGWVIYQVLDAYHTARARRDGTPLPNAFGLNDVGDRMGFGRHWPGSAARPVTSSTTAGWATADMAGTTTTAAPGNAAASAAGTTAGPNWAGYVPPTNFGAAATPPPPPPPQPTQYAGSPAAGPTPGGRGPAWSDNPYTTAYAGEPWRGAGVPPVPPIPMPPARRFPVGAAWLIALGLIFLLANLNADWWLSGAWIVTIVLGAVGSWMLFRRVEMVRAWATAAGETDPADAGIASRLMCQIRGPVMLLVLALLFALQAAGIRTLGQTWGVLLIAFGALLILERLAGRSQWYPVTLPANPAATAAGARKDGQ